MNYILEERKVAEKLYNLLSADFDIYSEKEIINSPGIFTIDGITHRSIPDLIIKPKKHLLESNNFIDTIIPIEIKIINDIDLNKYENLMFQCHSYRFSKYNDIQPKLCLYFIDNYFEMNNSNEHLKYDNETSRIPNTIDYHIKKTISEKYKIESLFGRFGIGEIITNGDDYFFRVKRQVLFQKKDNILFYKANLLNFWWGTKGNSKKI